jgi:hypothetical protein
LPSGKFAGHEMGNGFVHDFSKYQAKPSPGGAG